MIRLPNPLGRLRKPGAGAAVVAARGAGKRAAEAAARRDLLLAFESLGENCELGFVQEHLDAHPISLFRWSGITSEHLIVALDSDLSGIGHAEFSEIHVDNSNGEFFFRDCRYDMNTHTKMFAHEHTEEQVFRAMCTRSRRLREKLLEELQDGLRIFVINAREPLTDARMMRLAEGVHRLGPKAELLCVSPALDVGQVGDVRRVAPGLLDGRLDRTGFDGVRWRISYQLWLHLLAQAARLCGRPVPEGAEAPLGELRLPYGG